MPTSDWLIGSYPSFPAQTFAVIDHAALSENQTIATGSYYLHDAAVSKSLLEQLKTAVNAHSVIADANVGITKSGKVRVWRTGGSNFGITWGTATTLRDVLGFTVNLTGASTYTALNKSKFWWSGLRKASPRESPLGIVGQKRRDTAVGTAGDATMVVTSYNTTRHQAYFWRFVSLSRIWTSAEAGGEWFAFVDEVLAKGRQWKLWLSLDEDTAEDTLTVAVPSTLGPYKGKAQGWSYRREIANVDKLSPVELDCVQVAEFT